MDVQREVLWSVDVQREDGDGALMERDALCHDPSPKYDNPES